MQLAPPLLELEDIVRRIIAEERLDDDLVLSKFGHARGFILESVSLFREVEDTLYVNNEGKQKLDLCSQEMEHSLKALDRLQDATLGKKTLILNERLQAFLVSRTRCTEYFGDFSRLATEQPIYSPVPLYDAFIKAGTKVIDKQLTKDRLALRFPALIPELQKVERLVGLFGKLHQAPKELLDGLQQGLQGLQTGYGAIHQYLETDDETALKDGLKLVGSSSTILGAQFDRAEQFAGAEQKYSKFRPLEEWLRLKSYIRDNPQDTGIPGPWIGATVSQIFYIWDFLLNQGQGHLKNPLLSDVEAEGLVTQELLSNSFEQRDKAGAMLGEIAPSELVKTDDTIWLEYGPGIETLQAAVEACNAILEDQIAPFKELPGLERIAGLKEGVKRGEIAKSVLRDEFIEQLDRVEELIKSVNQAQDPISREFRDLLPIHRGAFIGMIENLEREEWDDLDTRWQSILTTLPSMANLSRTMRGRIAKDSSTARLVRCLRCGHNNEPSRRVCSSCGANLPAVVQKMQTFSEINLDAGGQSGGGGAVSVSPRAVDLLESLVRGQESNQTTRKDAADALQLMIDDVNGQRQLFSKKLLPMMGKDDKLDTYLRFFAQGLGTYFGALMEMHTAVEQGSLPRLHSGLAQAREILETLDQMKELIDEALRG